MKRLFLLLILAIVLSIASASCAKPAEEVAEPIVIGSITNVTGAWQAYGLQITQGQRLAVEDINAAGGVLGRKLELRVEDDQSASSQMVAAARKLAGDPKVVAMTASSTAAFLGINPLLDNELKILCVNPGAAGALSADFVWSEWHFRMNLIETKDTEALVLQKLASKIGATTIAIIEDTTNDYAVAVAKAVNSAAPEAGLEVVSWEKFTRGQVDFSSFLARLQRADPDILWLAAATDEIGLVVKQAKERGFTPLFVGGSNVANPAHFQASGGATEGIITFFPFSAEDPRPIVTEFAEKIRTISGGEPAAFHVTAYDSIILIAEAIEKAGSTDREAIRDAFSQLKKVEGVAGFYSYDGPGENTTPNIYFNVLNKEGKWVRYE